MVTSHEFSGIYSARPKLILMVINKTPLFIFLQIDEDLSTLFKPYLIEKEYQSIGPLKVIQVSNGKVMQ